MLNIFKNRAFISIAPANNSENIIEEIHKTFYSEADRLLEEAAKKSEPIHISAGEELLINKANRLARLGFVRTKERKDADFYIKIKEDNAKRSKENEELIEAINYFSQKYPLYKFITEESVMRICHKYGLVYGHVYKYTGSVPDKNLKQIENFKISEDDECYQEEELSSYSGTTIKYISFSEAKERADYEKYRRDHSVFSSRYRYSKSSLEIVAPLKDFDMDKSEIKNFKISDVPVLDPVVLKPVLYKEQKHYLIVTAWGGPEASDKEILNPIHN